MWWLVCYDFFGLEFCCKIWVLLWVWLGFFFFNFLDLSFDVRFEFCCCGLGQCWILFMGSTSCNFQIFGYVLHVLHVQDLRVFWSVWCFVFYIFFVRVTESREVGYGTVTVRITGGQSVKIETTGGHLELEANHKWVKCNYP